MIYNSHAHPNSVAKALQLTGRTAAEETVCFAEKFDKLFVCLNVSSMSQEKFQRNPFKSPYRSSSDFRLKVLGTLKVFLKYIGLQLSKFLFSPQWLEKDLLPYLEEWKTSVYKRDGFEQKWYCNIIFFLR